MGLGHYQGEKGHTRKACMENMKCGGVGRSRVCRSGESSEMW